MYNKDSLNNYSAFLETLLSKDYEFVNFSELSSEEGQVVMRHDIDFDCEFALEMAKKENALGVKAIYFFLLSNASYNIATKENFNRIKTIQKLGHVVSVHFDPTIYEDFDKGLEIEVNYFESLFETKVNIISLHRPNEFFQNYNKPIQKIEHTYQQKYFRDVKYVSDSTGVWRYGHPFDTEDFKYRRSLHILIHPIWWQIEGENNLEKLKKYFHQKQLEIKDHFAANCKPFRDIYSNL